MNDSIIGDPVIQSDSSSDQDSLFAADIPIRSRIFYLDNLRTFMIFLVVIYHSIFVYTNSLAYNWIVVDPVKNDSLGLVGMYIDLIVMFTLFFISGFFIPRSLENRTNWQFIQSKVKRIMIPWLIGVLTMIPAYKALYLYSRGMPQETWYTYFHWYTSEGELSYLFSQNPTQHWLWFLPVLFLFQLIYLFLYRSGLLKISINLKQATILVAILGIGYGLICTYLNIRGWTHSWFLDFQNERLLIYFMMFLGGSLCYKLGVMDPDVKSKRYYIWSNIGLTLGIGIYTVVALNLFFNMVDPNREYYFISAFADRVIFNTSMMLTMICFLYILIHSFKSGLNRSNSLLDQLSRNSYDVYIIHLVVIGFVALPLTYLSLPVFVKFLVVGIISFGLSNLLVSLKNLIVGSR